MTPSQPSRTPVVFLQGIGGAARLWDPQIASFEAAGYEPVALDLPGYGARPPVDHMTFDMLAADVEAAIERRHLDRPVIVGHSLGGMIAQTCLRRRPDGYRAAVLSGTSPAFGNPSGDFQKKFVADRLGPLDQGRTMADMATDIAAQIMGPNADPANRALLLDVMGADFAAHLPRGRCSVSSPLTSAPISATSRSRCCVWSANSTATRRRR